MTGLANPCERCRTYHTEPGEFCHSCAALASQPQAAGAGGRRTGWMVESKHGHGWWTGHTRFDWTKDPNKAAVFYSQREAEFQADLHWGDAFATEHVWLATAPAPAVGREPVDDARAVEASRKAQWAAVVQEPAFRLAEAFKEPGSTVTITKADAAAIGRCMDYFILATTRPSAAPASEAREGGWRWKYMRLVDAFDRYAQPWMTDDGEGGFAGALQRMALDAGKIALVREEMRAFQRGEIESKWAMFNISKTIDPDPYANEPPAAAPKPAAETGSTGARYFVSGPAMSFYTDDANAAEALLAAAGVDRDDWTITDLASPTQDAAHGGRG